MDPLIMVDLDDKEIGTASKETAHRLGRLHRAFSIFIISDGKMLIQKRNKNKYHSGGLWANACCSHPRRGESLSEAVDRRMVEELGFCCPLTELFSFVYYSQYRKDLAEYEYDHVFIGEYSGEVHFNPDEIEQIRWIDLDELRAELLSCPQQFASWFMIAAPRVLKQLS